MDSSDLRTISYCFALQILVFEQICNFAKIWTQWYQTPQSPGLNIFLEFSTVQSVVHMRIALWQTVSGEVKRRIEWKEETVRKWGMVSMRAAAGTACSQTRLKSETCTTTGPGGGRGWRERNTSGRESERERGGECPLRKKKAKYAIKCRGRERNMERYRHDRWKVSK